MHVTKVEHGLSIVLLLAGDPVSVNVGMENRSGSTYL